jgi:hypothetical protein
VLFVRGKRGQTMLEFALVSPVLFFVALAIFEICLMAFGVSLAHYAVGEASAVSARMGNDPLTDTETINSIRRSSMVTTGLVQIDQIEIRRVTANPNGDLVEQPQRNSWDGRFIQTESEWPASSRRVNLSNGEYVGVVIRYHYAWKTRLLSYPGPVTLEAKHYSRLEPQGY